MSTLSYHFPKFPIGAVRARARLCHPLRTPVSPVGRTRKDPPNYSLTPELRRYPVSSTALSDSFNTDTRQDEDRAQSGSLGSSERSPNVTMTHDQNRARLETLLRENDLSLARISVAIGRNKTYLQQYLLRGMPAVLAFQDTETLGRLLGCDPSELRHETRPAYTPQPRTRRHPPRRGPLVSIPEITVNASADADTIAEAYAAPQSAPCAAFPNLSCSTSAAQTRRGCASSRRRATPWRPNCNRATASSSTRPDAGRRWPTLGELFVLWDGNSIGIKRYERVFGFRAAHDQAPHPHRRPLPPALRLSRIRGPIPGKVLWAIRTA